MKMTREGNSAGSGNLVLLGPPGSGKGTQAKILQDKYDMIHISTGDIIRNAIANNTEAGKIAKEQINSGFLVTDELISMLLKEHISRKMPNENKEPIEKGFLKFPPLHQAQLNDWPES